MKDAQLAFDNIHYRGCSARVEYDEDDRIFFGRLTGIRDFISFHANTLEELDAELRISVDDYLAYQANRDVA